VIGVMVASAAAAARTGAFRDASARSSAASLFENRVARRSRSEVDSANCAAPSGARLRCSSWGS
jgi:hypothetical protein